MADMNTKKSLILISDNGTLPTPADFFETEAVVLPQSKPTTSTVERMTGVLGEIETIVDNCDITLENASMTHLVRHTSQDFKKRPDFGKLLKISAFDETYNDDEVDKESYTYTNTQNPTVGSAIIYIDGKKFTFTNTLIAETTIVCTLQETVKINSNLNGFYDNGGIPTDEANPVVTPSTEGALMVSCTDLFTEGVSTNLEASSISISMAPTIRKNYGFGRKDYTINNYVCTVEVTFILDKADYAKAIEQLKSQAPTTLDIKIGTDEDRNLINGKSLHITAPVGKVSDYGDSDSEGVIERTVTYTLHPDPSDSNKALSIKAGFFA